MNLSKSLLYTPLLFPSPFRSNDKKKKKLKKYITKTKFMNGDHQITLQIHFEEENRTIKSSVS